VKPNLLACPSVVALVLTFPGSFIVGIFRSPGQRRRGFRFKPVKSGHLNSMRIMAFGAYPPSLLAARSPGSYAFPVYASPPVNISIAMATAAQFLRLVKTYRIPLTIKQMVAARCAVTIETPQSPAPMHQLK
jgi:hypothetical protein